MGILYGKNIGLGFEFGLRGNKQEALNFANTGLTGDDLLTLETVDNDLQSYWLVGLNYAF